MCVILYYIYGYCNCTYTMIRINIVKPLLLFLSIWSQNLIPPLQLVHQTIQPGVILEAV